MPIVTIKHDCEYGLAGALVLLAKDDAARLIARGFADPYTRTTTAPLLGDGPVVRAAATVAQAAAVTAETDAADALDADALQNAAMSGDLRLVISPSTVSTHARATAWTRSVTIALQTDAGDTHTWYNGNLAASIADTSEAGAASIDDTTPAMVNGVATVVITGTAAAWLAGDTDTLTIADLEILGQTVTGGTAVQTFTAGE